MFKQKKLELSTQYADEGCWLYQDQGEHFRYFTKKVLLGDGAKPWPQCTNEEKIEWENTHQSGRSES